MNTLAIRLSLLALLTLSAQFVYGQEKECTSYTCGDAAYELRLVDGDGSQAVTAVDDELEAFDNQRSVEFESGGTVWVSQDPFSVDRSLEVSVDGAAKEIDGKFEKPVEFTLGANYPEYISRWELLIWRAGQSETTAPLHVISGSSFDRSFVAKWDGQTKEKNKFGSGDILEYALRVYDENDNIDQTIRYKLMVEGNKDVVVNADQPLIASFETLTDSITDRPELERQGIVLDGAMVRIYGFGFNPTTKIDVNGSSVETNADGKFAFDVIKEGGIAAFVINAETGPVDIEQKILTVDLEKRYFFMVGMADLTVGQNTVGGSSDILDADPDHYGGDIFVDGRLAFYLKGKIKGNYLITAQMDTGTENIENMFDNFHKRDPDSVFRRLDPDQYYPVYGDDSSLRDDTNSQGKLYVRLDWDNSWAQWGNFNTAFSGAELAPFNRSLYGAQVVYHSTDTTEMGDNKTQLSAFASQAQSLFRQSEFLGTGGSLYYLSDNDIVRGSEKIAVEVRREPGGRVIDKQELIAGRDYEIDYFQGRVVLKRPLVNVSTDVNPSIIKDDPLPGDRSYLVVDYEYTPKGTSVSDVTSGVRGKIWMSDYVALGGTMAHEIRDQQDYDLKGVDLTIKRAENTFIKFEAATTEASFQSARSSSIDGGLSFTTDVAALGDTSGSAASVEAQITSGDFNPDSLDKRLSFWAKQREAGYATANQSSTVDNSDIGVEAFIAPNDNWGIFTKAQRYEQVGQQRETTVSAKANYSYSDKVDFAGEYQHTVDEDLTSNTKGAIGVAAASVSSNVDENLYVYGIQQLTVSNDTSALDRDLTTVGAKFKANDAFKLNAEISTGDRGQSGLVGVEKKVSDSYEVYSNYVVATDANNNNAKNSSLVLGQRKALSSSLKVYSEHQFTVDNTTESFSHTVGLDNRISKFTSVSLSIQVSELNEDNGDRIFRKTLSSGIEYQRDKFRFNGKYEYREDDGPATALKQWVTTNKFEYRRSDALRWQARFNASLSDDELTSDKAEFVEAGIGFAYRPVTHDRLNMLGRLTYLRDLQPASQADEEDQNSIIFSTEALYDITKRISIGGKLAHRASERRLQANNGPWFGNDASLIGVRVRHSMPFEMDISGAYNWLWSEQSDDMRQGALVTVGKRVGNNLTFAAGYNFANFDDNLANDDFDVKGWFLNLVGTY